jgi:PAS domain S-box-containing protein
MEMDNLQSLRDGPIVQPYQNPQSDSTPPSSQLASTNPAANEYRFGSVEFNAKAIFLSAIALLCSCAVATYFSFSYLKKSDAWLVHTQEVRAAVGELEAALNHGARLRMSYLTTGDEADLAEFRTVVVQIQQQMKQLSELSKDNSVQVEHCKQLKALIADRIQAWEVSVAQKQEGKAVGLKALLRQSISQATLSAAATESIRAEEARLLQPRIDAAHSSSVLTGVFVVATFLVALALLYVHYVLLNRQLQARENAELLAREAHAQEAALRREGEDFRLFIDAVKDYAIFALDSTGHIRTWNEGAQRLKGYAASEIIGEHFSRFYPTEDVQRGKPLWELEVATLEGRVEDEGWRVRKDGSRFWADVVITATRNQAGQLIGFTKITRDFTERMRAQEALARTNAELAAEVNERKSAEAGLASSEKSLRTLSHHLLRTQDEERRRIGRDLHDSLGQYLAILKMNLDSLQLSSAANNNGAGKNIESCIRLADDSLKEVRTISYLLYPPMLEEMGLKTAIPWYLDGFSKRSSIQTTFELDPNFGRLTLEAELALFRVLQESLTNVHRHSGSSTAGVALSMAGDKAVLEIRDRGKGIPQKFYEQAGEDWMGSIGVGLRGMNERLKQLGGKLEITSNVLGTRVTAILPASQSSALADSA